MSGSPVARYRFVAETRGDPLGAFPALTVESEPFNLWLARALLTPALEAWSALDPAVPARRKAVTADFARVSLLGRARFRELLPAAAAEGDAAVLAAAGVVANLQRTLAALAEFLAAGGRLSLCSGAEPADLALSRRWCGLIGVPAVTALIAARTGPPRYAADFDYRRRDIRQLANVLGQAPGTVRARCRQALDLLGHEIRRSGLFRPDDLRHLRGHGVQVRARPPAPGISPVPEAGKSGDAIF